MSKIRVLQIGTGGLGSPCSLYLTAAGIKELTIIDDDTLEASNLQRQIIFNETQIGKNKVDSAKENLSKLNSDVKISAHKEYVDENSIKKHLIDQDFIVDCSDNMKTKFLVNRVAVENKIKCVIAGIKDFYGQIMTINPGKTACYQCVFPDPEDIKPDPNAGPLPVIGVTPGILGTLEALEIIKTTLGLPNLYNNLLMVNLLDMKFDKVNVLRDEQCFCSK